MAGSSAALPAARFAALDRVRQGDATVNAIAAALGVTDNAVRLHLAALERDGLVRRRGVVHSGQVGQPAAEFEITGAGGVALSSAYPPVLTALAESIGGRLDSRAKRALFLDAGRRLAERVPSLKAGSLDTRADACAELLTSLGGSVRVEHARGRATLVGSGCPLSSTVCAEPGACTIVEGLLERAAGLRVEQQCAHGEHPSCRFELRSDSSA
jgi:predicted ArsR family transcriptional regulator